jgi:hypothetical protein
MKKFLTRGLLGVGALAVPLGASLALPAAAAHAAPPGGSITATNDWNNPTGGTITGNLDVPAGVAIHLNGATVTGNVTVEGFLQAANTTFDKNVIVTGGHIHFDGQPTMPSTVKGNLNITGSDSSDVNGFWVGATIGGNFNYDGNSAQLIWFVPPNVGGQTNIS